MKQTFSRDAKFMRSSVESAIEDCDIAERKRPDLDKTEDLFSSLRQSTSHREVRGNASENQSVSQSSTTRRSVKRLAGLVVDETFKNLPEGAGLVIRAADEDGGKSKDERTEYMINDYWRSSNDILPVKFVMLFKKPIMDDDEGDNVKVSYDDKEDCIKSPPYTKEFHVLTEVQKSRILKVVEDVVNKAADSDYCIGNELMGESENSGLSNQISTTRYLCRKIFLPWVMIKVVEMVLCHIMQITFLSDDVYFEKKDDFLPVVFTYYLTLFIIIISLVAQLSCYSFGHIESPCYFMGILSSSILTLITSLGIIIMLTSMKYYETFLQVLVLIFIGFLLCLVFIELCLFYNEVKSIWSKGVVPEHFNET